MVLHPDKDVDCSKHTSSWRELTSYHQSSNLQATDVTVLLYSLK